MACLTVSKVFQLICFILSNRPLKSNLKAIQYFIKNPWPQSIHDEKDRHDSFPFITPDAFRALCDFRCESSSFDEAAGSSSSLCNFEASDIQDGDCVYIVIKSPSILI